MMELTDEEIGDVLNSRFGTDHERFVMVAQAQLAKVKDNLPDVWDGRGEMMTALKYRKKLEELLND